MAGAFIRSEDDHIAGPWSIADVDLALMLKRLVLNGDAVPAPLAATENSLRAAAWPASDSGVGVGR